MQQAKAQELATAAAAQQAKLQELAAAAAAVQQAKTQELTTAAAAQQAEAKELAAAAQEATKLAAAAYEVEQVQFTAASTATPKLHLYQTLQLAAVLPHVQLPAAEAQHCKQCQTQQAVSVSRVS